MDKKLKINTIYPLFFETSILTSVVQFFFSFHFQARADILRIHSRKMNLTRGINLKKIAEAMPGSSGAEIKVCLDGYKTSACLKINKLIKAKKRILICLLAL